MPASLEIHKVINPRLSTLCACLAIAHLLTACSSIENVVAGEKINYRSAQARNTALDVPPDLTQLSNDSRYQTQTGPVSAAALQTSGATSPTTGSTQPVAAQSAGDVRIEKQGNQRWLSTSLSPEQLWPQLQAFWQERGLKLAVDQPQIGVMETDWAENRSKLPNDFIRKTLGRILDPLYSTGERDKYRMRIERGAKGSEVYIIHQGLQEVYANDQKDTTVWRARPNDPQLEGEMLSRLMIKLGVKEETAKASVAKPITSPQPTARARILEGHAAATLLVDDNFERAWRRVGIALDRSGFTVEDRDRTQGIYFVRYVDPGSAGKEEPGFFNRLFGSGKGNLGPMRLRIAVKSEKDTTAVSVLNNNGDPEKGDAGKRIVALLLDELK